jgi:hypothetical protein
MDRMTPTGTEPISVEIVHPEGEEVILTTAADVDADSIRERADTLHATRVIIRATGIAYGKRYGSSWAIALAGVNTLTVQHAVSTVLGRLYAATMGNVELVHRG